MAEHAGDAKLVELEDGGVLNVVEVGSKSGHPLMLLHGGPGLDHHELRPWLDPLADMGFRLLYVDERGQGASPRVDPASLTMQVFAHDIDRLARALDLEALRRPRALVRGVHRPLACARARERRPVRDLLGRRDDRRRSWPTWSARSRRSSRPTCATRSASRGTRSRS